METEGFLKIEKLFHDFWLKTIRDSKGKAAKGHGKKFRSRLASSFGRIVHYSYFTEAEVKSRKQKQN